MSRYSKTTLINELRKRTGLERDAMLKFSSLEKRSLFRIEGEQQNPKPITFESLMKAIDLPMEGFVYHLLDFMSMETIIQCDLLNQLLDIGDNYQAEIVLAKIETLPIFEEGVHRQFLLSKKARLWEQLEKSPEKITSLIDEALSETYERFNETDIGEKVLVLEEPELLHTKARVFAKLGELERAIKILKLMKSSLVKLPTADKEKEKLFIPVLLSLSEFSLQIGDYEGVLEAYILGAEFSAKRKQGRYNPAFELYKAYALHGLNRKDECRKHLQYSYFGYALLGDTIKAEKVLTEAKGNFCIQFDLYGVDKLESEQQHVIPYKRGDPIECNSIGMMIKALREKAGLSLGQLSRGICDKSTLYRIEQGKSPGHLWNLEAIMQRLGRDISLYDNFFLSKDDFIAMQLRDRITTNVASCQYKEASTLLAELESMEYIMQHNVFRQFVDMIKAILLYADQDEPHIEYPQLLLNALRITCPQFKECDIDHYPLSYYEISIINAYASHISDTEDLSHANKLFERLRRNLDERCIDEYEKDRIYSTVLFNYSSSLGNAGWRQEALAIINEGERFERIRGCLLNLPVLNFNKGYNILMLGNKEESIPYFALAYYGVAMLSEYGEAIYLPVIENFLCENTGMNIG